jgi:signal transduction histidine kinase
MNTAKTLMHTNVLTCRATMPLFEAARLMRDGNCSSVIVEDQGDYVGIWTERDALKIDFGCPEAFQVPIHTVMSSPLRGIHYNTSVSDLATRFVTDGIRHLLVLDDYNRPLGIVGQTDLVNNHGVDGLLKMRDVRSVLRAMPLVLDSTLLLSKVAQQMREGHHDAAIIRFPDRTYGIVTERDVVRFITECRVDTLVGDVATCPLIAVDAATTLFDARAVLLDRGIRHIGVIDRHGDAIGIITFSTILHSLHSLLLEFAKQAAEEANHTKLSFLANVSHELRTPLHAILGYAELGSKRAGTRPAEDMVATFNNIHKSGKRLLRLITDLLDMAKIEAGAMDYSPAPENIVAVARDVAGEMSPLFGKKDQIFTLVTAADDILITIDKWRMAQVIRNLLANAQKFTPAHRRITLTIACPSPTLVSIAIADEGCGILEEELDVIFEKFTQGKKTPTNQGTGLGLAISREIVLAHGGDIRAANRPLGGAEITVTLPVASNAGGKEN